MNLIKENQYVRSINHCIKEGNAEKLATMLDEMVDVRESALLYGRANAMEAKEYPCAEVLTIHLFRQKNKYK
jgi:hypothetical protein